MRESAPAHDRLLALIDDFAGIRVAVFGDFLADEFIYGQIARVSREAPVLILDYDSTEIVPGGAGNAAKNVSALGGTPSAIGVAGADETGRRLLEELERGVEPARDRAAARLSNADQDAYPGRRRPFGEAAGRADRPGSPPWLTAARSAARSRQGSSGLRRAVTRCSCPTTARASSRLRSSAGPASALQVPDDRLPCSSIPATRCSGSGGDNLHAE